MQVSVKGSLKFALKISLFLFQRCKVLALIMRMNTSQGINTNRYELDTLLLNMDGEHLESLQERKFHMASQPHGSKDSPTLWP